MDLDWTLVRPVFAYSISNISHLFSLTSQSLQIFGIYLVYLVLFKTCVAMKFVVDDDDTFTS